MCTCVGVFFLGPVIPHSLRFYTLYFSLRVILVRSGSKTLLVLCFFLVPAQRPFSVFVYSKPFPGVSSQATWSIFQVFKRLNGVYQCGAASVTLFHTFKYGERARSSSGQVKTDYRQHFKDDFKCAFIMRSGGGSFRQCLEGS